MEWWLWIIVILVGIKILEVVVGGIGYNVSLLRFSGTMTSSIRRVRSMRAEVLGRYRGDNIQDDQVYGYNRKLYLLWEDKSNLAHLINRQGHPRFIEFKHEVYSLESQLHDILDDIAPDRPPDLQRAPGLEDELERLRSGSGGRQ